MKARGGPAFPTLEFTISDHQRGMGLRDYFAAVALQGLLAKEGATDSLIGNLATTSFAQEDAKRAYTYADAMLAERDK